MKRYLGAISAFFVFATATSAMAADFPAKAPQAPALIPVYDWTGIYVGGHIGGAWSTSSYNFAFAPSIACTVLPRDCFNAGGLKQSGVEGGAQAGFNYQV